MAHSTAATDEDREKLNTDFHKFFRKDIWGFVKGVAPFAILYGVFFFRSWTAIRGMALAAPLAQSPFLFLPSLCGPKYLKRFGLEFDGMASGPVRLLYFLIPYMLSRKDMQVDFSSIGSKKPQKQEKGVDMNRF